MTRGATPGEWRGGREKGTPNLVTRDFRVTVSKLLEKNSDNVGLWLDQVAIIDPAKALDLLSKLAEFAAPKLSRSEHTGGDGGPMQVSVVRFSADP